jgi:DNA-binding HxlR family transcriptional regulator
MIDLPIREILEVIRDGDGAWDTRAIDLNLGFRGVTVERGILSDLRELARMGLVEAVEGSARSAGPRWRLTEEGGRWLATSG